MTPQAVLQLMGLEHVVPMTASQTATMISLVIVQCGQEFQTQSTSVEQAVAATAALRGEVDAALIRNKAEADDVFKDLKRC